MTSRVTHYKCYVVAKVCPSLSSVDLSQHIFFIDKATPNSEKSIIPESISKDFQLDIWL